MSDIHVCANHRCADDNVFITYYDPAIKDMSWRVAKLSTVKRRGWESRVVHCHLCTAPAVIVDHFWPYLTEMNRCSQHKGVKP